MYDLATGTFDPSIFDEAEWTIEKNKRFLGHAGMLACDMADNVKVTEISPPSGALPTDRALHIQFADNRWIEVYAQEDTFSLRRSCGFHFMRPWYKGEDSFSHVRKAIEGFFIEFK